MPARARLRAPSRSAGRWPGASACGTGAVWRRYVGQRRPVHQLHDERVCRPGILEAVDLCDVRMVERGQHLRFTVKAREPIRIAGKRRGQDLERDVAAELGVAGAIDLAHTACAQLVQHLDKNQASCRSSVERVIQNH